MYQGKSGFVSSQGVFAKGELLAKAEKNLFAANQTAVCILVNGHPNTQTSSNILHIRQHSTWLRDAQTWKTAKMDMDMDPGTSTSYLYQEKPEVATPVGAQLWRSLRVYQIFGANTDVGKTVFTTHLINTVTQNRTDEDVAYLKPVSTGPKSKADDVCMLHSGFPSADQFDEIQR